VSSPSTRSTSRSSDKTEKRLGLLVRAGELFHQSLDLEQTLGNVARMAVESFAELCLFDLIDEASARLYVSVGAHRDPEIETTLKASVTPLLHSESRGIHPARRVAQSGRSFYVRVFDEPTILEHASSDEHERFMRRMGYHSKIVVPVAAQSEVFGALTFVRTTGAEPFEPEDVQAAEELGRRAGLAVANAKQYLREQHVADTLQRAFLNDDPPQRPFLRFHALYRGAQDGSALGGDWYDAFEAGDRIVMTVGDVTGKGLDAARLMVQIRQWVRLAAVVSADPGEMMRLLNRAMLLERKEALATAFIGVLERDAKTLAFCSAGHPPPLLKEASGKTTALEAPDVRSGRSSTPTTARPTSRSTTRSCCCCTRTASPKSTAIRSPANATCARCSTTRRSCTRRIPRATSSACSPGSTCATISRCSRCGSARRPANGGST